VIGDAIEPGPAIPRLPRDGVPPLSCNQEGWLALEAMAARTHPGPVTPYHLVRSFRLEGALDPAALEAALNQLVQRHEVLRSAFSLRPGQVGVGHWIAPDATISLSTHRLDDLTPDERAQQIGVLVRDLSFAPFDRARPPLLRAGLLRHAPAEHALVLVIHHLIADSWSLDLILGEELFQLYERVVAGRQGPLPELPIQYVDFAHWQRQWLRSDAAERAVRDWVSRWREFGPAQLRLSDLPFEPPDDPEIADERRREVVPLPPALSSSVIRCARARGVTPYMMTLLALQVALSSHVRQPVVAVMGHFANRTRMETTRVMGWFANAHVLGLHCVPDMTIGALLEIVRGDILAAHACQDVPVAPVWRRLQAEARDPRHTSRVLTDVYISLDAASWQARTGGDLRITPLMVEAPTAMTALNVAIVEGPGDLSVSCTYSARRFGRSGVRSLLRDVVRVLTAMVSTPATTVASLTAACARQSGRSAAAST
jgi:hypothetical protein